MINFPTSLLFFISCLESMSKVDNQNILMMKIRDYSISKRWTQGSNYRSWLALAPLTRSTQVDAFEPS